MASLVSAAGDIDWCWGSLKPWQLLHSKLAEKERRTTGSMLDVWELVDQTLGAKTLDLMRSEHEANQREAQVNLSMQFLSENEFWKHGGIMESQIREWLIGRRGGGEEEEEEEATAEEEEEEDNAARGFNYREQYDQMMSNYTMTPTPATIVSNSATLMVGPAAQLHDFDHELEADSTDEIYHYDVDDTRRRLDLLVSYGGGINNNNIQVEDRHEYTAHQELQHRHYYDDHSQRTCSRECYQKKRSYGAESKLLTTAKEYIYGGSKERRRKSGRKDMDSFIYNSSSSHTNHHHNHNYNQTSKQKKKTMSGSARDVPQVSSSSTSSVFATSSASSTSWSMTWNAKKKGIRSWRKRSSGGKKKSKVQEEEEEHEKQGHGGNDGHHGSPPPPPDKEHVLLDDDDDGKKEEEEDGGHGKRHMFVLVDIEEEEEEEEQEQEGHEDLCPVCLENLDNSTSTQKKSHHNNIIIHPHDYYGHGMDSNQQQQQLVQLLACGHSFHTHCLSPWLLQASCCPCCRAPIPPNHHQYPPNSLALPPPHLANPPVVVVEHSSSRHSIMSLLADVEAALESLGFRT